MIRPAYVADEPAIRDCAEQAFARYIPRIGRKPAPMTDDYAARIAAGHAYVAEDGQGGFQGYVVFFPQGDHIYLDSIAVRPDAAGQGVGKALLRFCESRARDLGFAQIRLCTNAAMTENLLLYPHLGFVETGRGQQDGFDRVFFAKQVI